MMPLAVSFSLSRRYTPEVSRMIFREGKIEWRKAATSILTNGTTQSKLNI